MLGRKESFVRDKECLLDVRITQHALHKGSIHTSHIIIPLLMVKISAIIKHKIPPLLL
jgi:hypothetical protein